MNMKIKKLSSIVELLKEEKVFLKEKYKVKSLGIFGSYVRNKQTENSDLDVLIEFSETPTLLKFIELESYLNDRLGVKIDLVMKSALKSRIGKHILEEVIILWGKEKKKA